MSWLSFLHNWSWKATLTKNTAKVQHIQNICFSTARKPRPNEIDGIDYNFIDNKSFQEK